jgi:hypothetical protein
MMLIPFLSFTFLIEAGRSMILQGAGFASTFQVEDEIFNLAPSGSQWSDPDLPHQFSTRSGAVAKFNWRGVADLSLSFLPTIS